MGRQVLIGLVSLLEHYHLVLLGLGTCWAIGQLLWMAIEPWLAIALAPHWPNLLVRLIRWWV